MQKVPAFMLALLISLIVSCTIAAAQSEAASAVALMQLAKLTASDGAGTDQFGTYAALSGNTAVVGASANHRTEAYVFVKGANGWMDMTETAKLVSSDGSAVFGSVAISGNTIAVSGYDSLNNTSGVYVFERPSSGWTGTRDGNCDSRYVDHWLGRDQWQYHRVWRWWA